MKNIETYLIILLEIYIHKHFLKIVLIPICISSMIDTNDNENVINPIIRRTRNLTHTDCKKFPILVLHICTKFHK